MARAFLLVMDSLGVGGAPDAEKFGDLGANTFGSICKTFHNGGCEKETLKIPFLQQLGLGLAAQQASGTLPAGLEAEPTLVGQWGSAAEISSGKDTISGHWEMAGVPVKFEWGYFQDKTDSFPKPLLDALIEQGELAGVLGNCHASGTEIIKRLGEAHIKTGKPIVYTSADSVMQIAAHETHFGLDRLLDLCAIARRLVDPYNIGRVIARPFDGDNPDNFARTANRHDYSVPPSAPTLLDRVVDNGGHVHAVGKVSDIFAAQGVSHKYPASGHGALMQATLEAGEAAQDGDLVFTNFVDFDMLYGHRRNVCGYGLAIEEFDTMLQEFSKHLKDEDMVILTADHGNDPTWPGSDHTREQVPILIYGKRLEPKALGQKTGFNYIADRISDHLGLPS